MCSAAMLRRLLACLALITGLAAGAPAQAEVAAAIATADRIGKEYKARREAK